MVAMWEVKHLNRDCVIRLLLLLKDANNKSVDILSVKMITNTDWPAISALVDGMEVKHLKIDLQAVFYSPNYCKNTPDTFGPSLNLYITL